MKILQILDDEPWGGCTAIVHAIVRALVLRGDDVWIIPPDEVTAHHFEKLGAHIVMPPRGLRSVVDGDLLLAPWLFLLCRRERFDLVVIHAGDGGFAGETPARLARVPHIIRHAHGLPPREAAGGRVRKTVASWLRPSIRSGDLTICAFDEHRRLAAREGVAGAERMLTIRDGVNAHLFAGVRRGAARRELGLQSGEVAIGSLGRLEAGRGHEFLLYAMLAVIAREPAARLLIAGGGRLAEELRQEASLLGLGDRVRFLGNRREALELLPGLDIFVRLSPREESAVPLLEAMAAGIPVVATDIPGNRELIHPGETGLLVPPGNSSSLADAICELLREPALARRLGSRAREVVRRCFPLEGTVRENLKAYQLVMETSPWAAGGRHLVATGAASGR